MLLSRSLGQFTRGESDALRKAMGKKQIAVMEKLYAKFVDGCLDNEKFMAHCKDEADARAKIEKIWGDWRKFAEYAFNKSHSVCYAYVAYQTGYLKAHYPVDFMCAQISSEIGNFDKMPALVSAAADMGLEVLPPDVNASCARFAPEGKAVRYGLSAIRGVGELAGEAIERERREHGPYKGLLDFCRRLCCAACRAAYDGKTPVNKRVIEALIRSGAMASFKGAHMGQLLASVDFALSRAAEADRDGATGQGSLFDLLGEENPLDAEELPDAPPISEKERLQAERELLGVYITGHPLDRYRMLVNSFGTCRLADLGRQPDEALVRVAGFLSGVRQNVSKKTKEAWAALSVDDGEASVEALAFPRCFAQYGSACVPDTPVLICGSVKHEDERGTKIFAKEIYPLTEAPRRFGNGIGIRCRVVNDENSCRQMDRTQEILSLHPGDFAFTLRLELPERTIQFTPDARWRIDPSPECIRELEEVWGRNSVTYTGKGDVCLDPKNNRVFRRHDD